MIPPGLPLWIYAALITGVLCWACTPILAAMIAAHAWAEARHHRAMARPADDEGWGDEPLIETRPGKPSPDLNTCHHIWPDPPTWPRKEEQQ